MLFQNLFDELLKEIEYTIKCAEISNVILVNNVTGKIELCGNGKDYYHYVYKTSEPMINPITGEEINFEKEIQKYKDECQKLQQVQYNIY